MSTEQNQAIIRRCFQELDRQNLDVLDDLCTPDYVAHFPGMPGPQTRDTIKPVWGQFFVAFPNLRHTIELIIAEGDRVVARLTIEAVHTGSFMGLPPTGRTFRCTYSDIWRLEDGKGRENWVQMDMLGLMQQLGAGPA